MGSDVPSGFAESFDGHHGVCGGRCSVKLGMVEKDLIGICSGSLRCWCGEVGFQVFDIRHTHATLMLKDGVPVKVVSERLGHLSVAFSMQVHQHVLPGMQADAAATFGDMVFGER